jgi:NodT family efflux transporter outer membrane factor (OMF) lipoprotein
VHRKSIWMTAASALVLMGCAVGPEFHSPKAPETKAFTATALPAQTAAAPGVGGNAQHFNNGEKIPRQWWRLFHSDALDHLIRLALNDNPTAAAAQASLREARENYRAQFGTTWYPSVDANLSAARQRVGGASAGQSSGGGTRFDLYNASVNVSYLLDIFGGERRALEALKAQVDYQGFQLQGTYLTLTANTVTTAIREASLRAQLQATKEILQDQQQAYGLVQRQFQLGSISRADVLAQKTQLARTQATLPPLEKALSQTRHQLAILVGRLPGEAASLPAFDITTLELPADLPVSLPSALVRQRPDIRSAEALLHAASARVGVATANLYPSITLTGSYGSETNTFGDLFRSDTVIWNLGAGLLQPLFHGGALTAKRRAAIAAFQQSLALYRQTVLQAFLNVADVLRALESDARSLNAQSEVAAASRDTLQLTKKQFQFGAISYLSLLDAQRQYQQARLNLVQAQALRFADTAALFQALGGGWWYPVSPDKSQQPLSHEDQSTQ